MRSSERVGRTSHMRGGIIEWLITVLLVIAIIGAASWWRRASEGKVPFLPRTQALINQKVGSLEAYNKAVPEQELLDFFSQHLQGRPVESEAFTKLTDLIIDLSLIHI